MVQEYRLFLFGVFQMGLNYRKAYVFDFESLVDIRSGYIRFMLSSKTVNKSFFKPYLWNPTVTMLKNLYVSSSNPNPLTWILKNEYQDSAEDLYRELIEKHYEEIINFSLPTDVFRLMALVNRVDIRDTEFTINCANDIQANVASNIMGDFTITVNEYNAEKFSCIYASTIDILDKYRPVEGKNVYIHNIRMNYDENFRLEKTMNYYIGHVVIHTIDPYIGIPLFKDKQMVNTITKEE